MGGVPCGTVGRSGQARRWKLPALPPCAVLAGIAPDAVFRDREDDLVALERAALQGLGRRKRGRTVVLPGQEGVSACMRERKDW